MFANLFYKSIGVTITGALIINQLFFVVFLISSDVRSARS